MKIALLYLLLVVLCSCKESDKSRITRLVKEWEGKEIIFPEEITFTRFGVDTLDYQLPETDWKIVSYIDSTGCTSCKLQFYRWEQVMHEMDSIVGVPIPFLFLFHPKNKSGHKELVHLMKRNQFLNPVWIDVRGDFYKINKLPVEKEFHSFLINKQNKIAAIGSPFANPKVKELYLKIIYSGIQVDSLIDSKMTSAYVKQPIIDLGEFDVNTIQEAVFTLTNNGKERLVINDIIYSCGCISVDYIRKPIASGEDILIHVKYEAEKPEYIDKSLIIYANTKEPLRVSVRGNAR